MSLGADLRKESIESQSASADRLQETVQDFISKNEGADISEFNQFLRSRNFNDEEVNSAEKPYYLALGILVRSKPSPPNPGWPALGY